MEGIRTAVFILEVLESKISYSPTMLKNVVNYTLYTTIHPHKSYFFPCNIAILAWINTVD